MALELKHYVIVGYSAAGLSALETIRRHDEESKITLVCDEDLPPYSRVLLTYVLAKTVEEKQLYLEDEASLRARNVECMFGKRATAVRPQEGTLVLEDGTEINYDELLIATGASPTIPPMEGDPTDRLCGLRKMQDSRKLLSHLSSGDTLALVGGGLVGMQAASAVCRWGAKAILIITSKHIVSQILDRDEAGFLLSLLPRDRLDVMFGESVARVKCKGDKIDHLELQSGKTVKCDFVLVGKGVQPNVGFLEGSGVGVDWGVIVDEHMRTNVPNVYAAGDVALSKDFVTGEPQASGIWPAAADQGRVAALNMLGKETDYPGFLRVNISTFFDIPVFSAGLVRVRGEDHEIRTWQQDGRYAKLVLKDGVLKGVVTIGRFEDAGLIQSLIYKQCDVSSLTDPTLCTCLSYPLIFKHTRALT